MFGQIKNRISHRIESLLRATVRREIEAYLPVLSQLVAFHNSSEQMRSSHYDHTKNPLENIQYYAALKDELIAEGIPVEEVDVDLSHFEHWLDDVPELRRHYQRMDDVFIEKCLEHYLPCHHLGVTSHDVYIDVASAGSPWASILNQRGVKAYRLDLAFPEGVHGIDIGADAGDTGLPDGFATVMSLQCAFECLMGDADIEFVKEASRVLRGGGRYGIVPLYLEDTHVVATSPFCDQRGVRVEDEAKRVWRDDEYKAPFSRSYSPEAFKRRVYANVPDTMTGKVYYFRNLADVMERYDGQRVYCFFMFHCQKLRSSLR